MYKNYIFDLYGTLVDIHTDESSTLLWEKLSLFYSFKGAIYSAEELKTSYLQNVKLKQTSITNTKYPDFPIEEIFNSLFEDKHIKVSKDTVNDAAQLFRILSIEYIKLYDGVIELLELLKKNSKKIYLLSNAQRIFTLYEMRLLDIEKYFDGICFSSDYYVCKPDMKFYNTIIGKFNLKKEESIMIGNDFIADIQGAAAIGLDSLYIDSNLSPEITTPLQSNFSIMSGNVREVAPLIVNS
ncbi:HAD family hydrolase [Inconstantimicrobium mannanitabidum]|uniref:Haloacid dehalogenase n=1 Tax=Inconstantimicrobium mannanitabidum TaxID=1604901 RepID=A0ACB5REE5_9CLOT|nr:HAD family hydrolase [Clostridium sp. TW13]GKX67254.1 haloacid dehalogenase [Clostridium sp. TW13]